MNNLTIPAYSEQAAQAVKERLDSLAKVPGSLGKPEELAIRLAGITGRTCPSFPQKSVVLFAADHDITLKGVSATGQEVTEIQVRNFLKGGGTINAFCRNAGASLTVVDVGIKGDVGGAEGLVRRKVVHAARDFSEGPAMTREEALACVQVGIDMAHEEAKKGVTLLSAGEMGIGNTSPSSAIAAVLTGGKSEQIGRFSLHTLSTYGIMSEQTAVRVRQLVDVLLERGLLTADPERYNALFLTKTGNALMRGRGELHIRLPREKKPETVRRTEELSADVDEKLFEKLRALRTKVAQRAGVPPYVVFSNATLADMAARQPKSEYELLGVRGVGEAKARRYGAEFVDCIRDYLEEN